MLMHNVTDYHCRGFSPTGRSERHTDRWAVVGVLALALGALAVGLVHTSRTRPLSAVRTGALAPAPTPPRSSPQRPRAAVQTTLPQLPLAFIENRGQMDPQVGYYVQGREITLSFTPQGLTATLTGSRTSAGFAQSGQAAPPTPWVVTLDFVGANPDVRPQGLDLTPAPINHVTGHQRQWQTELPTYAGLRYREVWPGIDLLSTTTGGQLTFTFVVKPGADPNQIQFAYQGVTAVRRTEAGQLEVTTPVGSFSEGVPVAYQESRYLAHWAHLRDGVAEDTPVASQERDGRWVEVAVAYALETSGDTPVHGIHVGTYDPNTPLIVDLVVRYPGSSQESLLLLPPTPEGVRQAIRLS